MDQQYFPPHPDTSSSSITSPRGPSSAHFTRQHPSTMSMYNLTQGADGALIYTNPSGVVYFASGKQSNCTLGACPIEISTYGYRPSLPFQSLLIALYFLCALAQSYLGWRYKNWSYMSAMLLGCICEIIGYAGRILMWQNPWNHPGFIIQIGAYLFRTRDVTSLIDFCSQSSLQSDLCSSPPPSMS